LCAALAAGYAFLAVDTAIEHHLVLAHHRPAYIPPVAATVLAVILIAACLVWSPALRKVARGALWLSLAVGLLGLYFHNIERVTKGFSWGKPSLTPPILAPLGFAGQGLMGLVLLWERSTSGDASRPAEGDSATPAE